jgi:hypothetical protein
VILVLFFSLAWFSGRVASAIFCRHEIPLSSIYGEKICDHLARYRKCRPIGVPFLFLSSIEERKIMIVSGRQLRSLDRTNWIFLLRCLEIGVRIDFSAELLSSPQRPQ